MIRAFFHRYGNRKITCLSLDVSSFLIGFAAALTLVGFPYSVAALIYMSVIFLICSVMTVVTFRYCGLYRQRMLFSNLRQVGPLLKSALFTFFLLLVIYFVFETAGTQSYFRMIVLTYVLISYLLVVLGRFVIFHLIFKDSDRLDSQGRNAIAVGAGNLGVTTARKLNDNQELGYKLVGFVDDNLELRDSKLEGVRVLGSTEDLAKIVAENEIEEIFVTINNIDHVDLIEIIRKCKSVGCTVNVVSNHFETVEKRIDQTECDELRFVSLFPRPSNIYQAFIKRILDLVVASSMMLVLLPVFIVLGLAIKITSNGPVFYVALAIGKDRKSFKFYKFRSMHNDVSDNLHRELIKEFISGTKTDGRKLEGDPRITQIGHFIRKYSLDELPQLFNVLRGDMSLVGPRPSTLYEYQMMEEWHRQRFSIQPGMTGVWQISGRSEVSFRDMMLMDIYYVENCSLWLDLTVLLKTAKVVVLGTGGA